MSMNVNGTSTPVALPRPAATAAAAALEALAGAVTAVPSKPAPAADDGPKAADPLGGGLLEAPDLDAITVPAEDTREANNGTQGTGGGGTGTRGGPRRSA